MQSLPFYFLAIGAGGSFIMQQAVNANLRTEIGSAWWAGLVSYLGGTLAMLVMVLAFREPLFAFPSAAKSSWVSWTGGLFGAVYIASSIILVPKLGAATTVAFIVLGQMLGSLLFDHFGLFGVPVHEITAVRGVGTVLLLAGVILIRF
jgi:transporter family-2 protein